MSKKKPSKNKDQQTNPSFKVQDKRFWNKDREDEPSDDSTNTLVPSFVVKLEKELQDKEQEITKLGMAIRAQREEQRKIVERIERQKASEILGMKCSFFEKFLEIGDNFELCLESIDKSDAFDKTEAQGVKMIYQQFMKTLADNGVQKLDVINKPFDPDQCEAVATKSVNDSKLDNVVVEEYRSGYIIEDRLIRPARVTVGQHKEDTNHASQSGTKSD